ncbi:Nucleotide-binding universal stress protein, UspA family [Hymenobacter gelipurpurascens]|uniref:Nucleotide-binding universal stress protein, UspA family n=1 Tax=Hymenobacter gelipurpurascens TaxID=89968 RepID=A0A212TKZ6_9BACT|nr:universal stress protein [Hymenobacter gelipurpurascens]SNC66526.1 Nucleotide-binding universal stress protein, UspA family [Hymenobacter gelipurpurascens]
MTPSVVVLTNLSATAERAARYAAILAAPLHLPLALLHLYHDPVLDPELVTVTVSQAYRNQAETMGALQELAARLPTPAAITVSVQPLTQAVEDAIDQYKAGLLAMGLSTEYDLLDHVLHNQALPILRATPQPLLLVPEAAEASWLPRRISLALDADPFTLSEPSRRLLPLLHSWSADFTVVHTAAPHEKEAFRGQRALAQAHLNALLPAGKPAELYEEYDLAPGPGILHALEDTQADMLVLIARPHSFLGHLFHRSVTSQVLRQCQVPVLLLPAKEQSGWMPALS